MHHSPVRHRPLLRRHRVRRRIQQRLERGVAEPFGERPVQARKPRAAQIAIHRPDAQSQAMPDRPLTQPLRKPQPQHLPYLPHRQSLARHSDPSLLSKGPDLPMVEGCQQQRPALTAPHRVHDHRNRCSRSTGCGVQDRLDWVFTIKRNSCSRSTGTRRIGVIGPLAASTILRKAARGFRRNASIPASRTALAGRSRTGAWTVQIFWIKC